MGLLLPSNSEYSIYIVLTLGFHGLAPLMHIFYNLNIFIISLQHHIVRFLQIDTYHVQHCSSDLDIFICFFSKTWSWVLNLNFGGLTWVAPAKMCWFHMLSVCLLFTYCSNYSVKTGDNVHYQQRWSNMLVLTLTIFFILHIVWSQSSRQKAMVLPFLRLI